MTIDDAWIDRARAYGVDQRRARDASDEAEIIPGQRPAVLEGDGVRALLVPMLAAVAWVGAAFRELVSDALDPLALLMRLLALGLSIRGLVLLFGLVARLRMWSIARRSFLVLTRHGLFASIGGRELAVPRDVVVAALEPSMWQRRSAGRRYAPVVVITSESPTFVTLPPIFDDTPSMLAERLMRWRGVVEVPDEPTFPAPQGLASQVYDDAARGIAAPGVLTVPHGTRWLLRGPFLPLVLGALVVDGLARVTSTQRIALAPVALGSVLLAASVAWGWYFLTRREITPRRGLAMVLTPSELLLRTRSGVLRTPWSSIEKIAIESKLGSSLLLGVHEVRTLVIVRRSEPVIRYDEAFLGHPAEAVRALLDAARTGRLAQPPISPAS